MQLNLHKVGLVFVTAIAFLSLNTLLFGQAYTQISETVTLNYREVSAVELLKDLRSQTSYTFSFAPDELEKVRLKNIHAKNEAMGVVLQALTQSGLKFALNGKMISVSYEKPTPVVVPLPQPKLTVGQVTDESGQPLPGVTVAVKGTSLATATDDAGNYSLANVPDDAILVFSFAGMKTEETPVAGRATIHITMEEDVIGMEEVIVVGYGAQKKATLTGSVVAIQNEEIVKTKNENVLNMLTGKMPGLRVSQQSSEPGTFSSTIDIRGLGSPLVIIDGIPRENIARLDPNDIESISVLKDASAAVYGVKAANGVILVTTKSGGSDDRYNISYTGNTSWQTPSGLPRTVDAVDYMLLANEHDMNQVNGAGTWRYSQEMIDAYRSGLRSSTNWYDAVIRDFAPQAQHNVSVSGGTPKTQYFTSFGYQFQESFFNSDQGFDYNKYNLRANLTSRITDHLSFELKTNAIMDQRNRTQYGSNQIVRATWRQLPIDPIYANGTPPYYFQTTISEANNPVAWIDRDYVGYIRYHSKTFQSSAALSYNVPFVNGLTARALYSYDYGINEDKNFSRSYQQYRFDETANAYTAFTHRTPSQVRRDFYDRTSTMYQLSLNYVNTFGNAHNVNALLLTEGRKQEGDSFYSLRQLSIDIDELFAGNADNQIGNMDPSRRFEYANESFIGRVNYDFRGKYLVEGAFRVDGSSRFPANSRWGFFPAASVGYRISEENFWKNSALSFVSDFKLRASYGIMGDDSGVDYQFVTGYTYPASAAFFGGAYVNGVASTGIPNYNITWYESETMNAGFDMQLWNGLLGVTFDVFQRNRTGLLTTRIAALPGMMGAELPEENLNSDVNLGYELELNHKNTIGELRYSLRGHVALTRLMNKYVERADDRSRYHNWRNNTQDRYKNIWWGLQAGGQYRSFAEIAEFPVYTSRGEIPGNYYHEDWNGDGVIDGMDLHPIGLNTTPLLNFGFTGDFTYKWLDLYMLWQGAELSNVF